VLQIDHVRGGGRQERKQLCPEAVLQKILQVAGEGYQILCANCNWIKRHEEKEHIKLL
jgi:hypothetical protein